MPVSPAPPLSRLRVLRKARRHDRGRVIAWRLHGQLDRQAPKLKFGNRPAAKHLRPAMLKIEDLDSVSGERDAALALEVLEQAADDFPG